jgi:hypothetical protein
MLMIERALKDKIDGLIGDMVQAGDLINLWVITERASRLPSPQEVIRCLDNCKELTWADDESPLQQSDTTDSESPSSGQKEGVKDEAAPGPGDASTGQGEGYRGQDAASPDSGDANGPGTRRHHFLEAYKNIYDIPDGVALNVIMDASVWFSDNGYYAHARACVLTTVWKCDPARTQDMLRVIGEAAWENDDPWTALVCFEDCGDQDLMIRFADDLAGHSIQDQHSMSDVIIEAYNTVGESEKLIQYAEQLANDGEWETAMEALLDAGAVRKALALIDRAMEADDTDTVAGLIDQMEEYVNDE